MLRIPDIVRYDLLIELYSDCRDNKSVNITGSFLTKHELTAMLKAGKYEAGGKNPITLSASVSDIYNKIYPLVLL